MTQLPPYASSQPLPQWTGGNDAPAAVPPPPPVINAARLMLVRAGIAALSVVVLIATRDSLRHEIAKRNPGFDPHRLDTAVNAGIAFGVVFGLVFVGIYVLLAAKVRQARTWARIVAYVLAGLGVLGALSALARATVGASRVVGVIAGLIDVAIIVLLSQGPSNEFFRQRR